MFISRVSDFVFVFCVLSLSLSLCLPACLSSLFLSVTSLSQYLCFCPSVSVCLPVCLLSFCLWPGVCLSVCLFVSVVSVCMSQYLNALQRFEAFLQNKANILSGIPLSVQTCDMCGGRDLSVKARFNWAKIKTAFKPECVFLLLLANSHFGVNHIWFWFQSQTWTFL